MPVAVIYLVLLAAAYSYNYFFGEINGDEAMIAEHAYSFSKSGIVQSELFEGMGIGWAERQYHYHKFFVIMGAVVQLIAGNNIFALRLIPLIFLLITFLLAYNYLKRTAESHANGFLWFIVLFLTNAVFFDYGLIFRPEVTVMAFGFTAFYLLDKGLKNLKPAMIYPAAVSAGFSAFTHLNGLSFIFAGFILLLVRKKYKHAIGFGALAALTAGLYFFDLTTMAELQSYWQQFSNDPNLSREDFSLLTPFIKLLGEQQRFLWNLPSMAFTLLLVVSLVGCFRLLREHHFNLLVFFLALIIGLAGLSHGKTIKYGILYHPYIFLIISISLRNFYNMTSAKRRILVVALAFFMMVNTVSIGLHISRSQYSMSRINRITAHIDSKGVKLMGHEFLYFAPEKEFKLTSPLSFQYLYQKYIRRKPDAEDYMRFAREHGHQYVLHDMVRDSRYIRRLFNLESIMLGQRFFGYRVIIKNKEYILFERLQDRLQSKKN